MINTRKGQSAPTGYKLSYCGVDFGMMSNKQYLRENDLTEEKGIQSCLKEENGFDQDGFFKMEENDLEYDDLLRTISSTCTTFSMDSSDSSEDMSVESWADDISTDAFEGGSASVEIQSTIQNEDTSFNCSIKRIVSTNTTSSMDSSDSSENMTVESSSTIEKMDTSADSISTADFRGKSEFKDYGKYEQCKIPVSELASKRLYFMAAEKKKRLLLLAERLRFTSNLVDYTRNVRRNGSEPMSSVKSIYNANHSANCVKKGRCPKTVKRSSVVQMKDNKLNDDPNKGMGQSKGSTSEILGKRLYLEGIEKKKRLARLKKEYYKPKLPLETVFERRRIDTNSSERDSECIEHLQQLYALSKPSQEDGKERRKSIEKASAKRNEVWIHPSEKISIADSTRLYYMGMSQLVALERRRIEASEPSEYRPTFLQSS